MKARPILFSGEMVRALLDGRRTQTRRVVKPQPMGWEDVAHIEARLEQRSDSIFFGGCLDGAIVVCPYGVPGGDLLWVRESWAQRLDLDHLNGTQLYESGVREAWYWADGPGRTCRTGCAGAAGRVRAARFMPRWASRLTLRLTDVRVERVQDISEKDARAEGARAAFSYPGRGAVASQPRYQWGFHELWNSINEQRGHGWHANPWVWALTFDVLHRNVNDVLREPTND